MTQERDAPSLTNIVWGLLFIAWGALWLLASFDMMSLSADSMDFICLISPGFWVVLGLIILFRDDGKVEEIRP